LVAGITQLFRTIPTARRLGRDWHYVGIAGTVVLIILFLVTRIPNPITGGRKDITITAHLPTHNYQVEVGK
jgi:hypothetical protein